MDLGEIFLSFFIFRLKLEELFSFSTLIASINPFLTLNIDEIPPITMAPTPTYLIFEDHISQAPSNRIRGKI